MKVILAGKPKIKCLCFTSTLIELTHDPCGTGAIAMISELKGTHRRIKVLLNKTVLSWTCLACSHDRLRFMILNHDVFTNVT